MLKEMKEASNLLRGVSSAYSRFQNRNGEAEEKPESRTINLGRLAQSEDRTDKKRRCSKMAEGGFNGTDSIIEKVREAFFE